MATVPDGWTVTALDRLADELHDMLCKPLNSGLDPAAGDDRHRELDLGRARFVATGLAARGWFLEYRQRPACHA